MIWIICKSKCTTSCNLVFGGAYNADKSNLVKLATKSVCVPLRVRRNCYVRTPVHHSLCQRSLMPCGVLGGTCANAIDHFRITFGLFFKASLGAHPFI